MPFLKLQQPREFKIETYYYKPADDEDPKHRIHFRRIRHSKRIPKTSPLRLILAIVLLVFVIYMLQKQASSRQETAAPRKLQVEEIIIID